MQTQRDWTIQNARAIRMTIYDGILHKGDLVYYTGPALARKKDGFTLSGSAMGVVLNPSAGTEGERVEVLWAHMDKTWVGPQYWLKLVVNRY